MTTLAFDGRTGASGDMLLGALADAGADVAVLAPVEDALDVSYEFETVDKRGVAATKATVRGVGGGDGRTPADVEAIVESMALPEQVREDALAVVSLLAAAEGAVHGTEPDHTHFHEVGTDDAIADIVGTVLLLDDLDPDEVVTAPLAAGGGEVTFSHGTYPVPSPAVVEIAERADWSTYGGPADVELLTPTGAALLAYLADGVSSLPPLRVDATGNGAGSRDLPERPNVLRAIVGDSEGALVREDVAVLETNLDDAAPETLGRLQDSLAAAGARDVSIVPLTMKKSRPGHLVKVVCRPADEARVARRLAEETGTLGVRAGGADHRWIAHRHFRTAVLDVAGERFEVSVKVATDETGAVYDLSAEHDDAERAADATDLPAREVAARAEAAVRGDPSDVVVRAVRGAQWNDDRIEPDAEGIVGFSKPEQICAVADSVFEGRDGPFCLLVVDPAAVDADIVYEPLADGHYPRVHGAVDADAVVDVLPFEREAGSFVRPADL